MKIIGIIPARGGSKGVLRKNIKNLAGKPLLQYTSEAALDSKRLSKVILSTDDEEIAELGKKIGLEVPFMRPVELAVDTTPMLPVIQHVIDHFNAIGENYDAVCLLQVINPLRTYHDIDKSILMFEKNKPDSLVSVLPIPSEYNPHWAFIPDEHGFLKIATGDASIISRRQDLPKAYFRDGSIYLTKSSIITEENSLYGSSMAFMEMDPSRHVNIDTPDDWQLAEELIKNITSQVY